MAVYYVMYACIFVTALCERKWGSKDSDAKKRDSIICFSLVALLLVLRHQSMGMDLHWTASKGYLWMFDQAVGNSFSDYLEIASKMHYEWFFKLYTWLVAQVFGNRQFFMAVTALLSLIPVAYLFYKKSCDPILSWIIYLGMSPFLVLFSALRQGMTIGLAVLLYILAEEKKIVPYIAVLVLAVMLHTSSVILIVIYPAVNIRLNMKIRLVLVALLLISIFFRKWIVKAIGLVFPMYAKYLHYDGIVAYRLFAVFVMIYLICCALTDGSNLQNSYMNLFFLACCCQFTGLFSQETPREGFYFMPALCILLPSVISNMNNRKLANVLKAGTYVCFTAFGLYELYETVWTISYPYRFFWQ